MARRIPECSWNKVERQKNYVAKGIRERLGARLAWNLPGVDDGGEGEN